MTTSPYPQGPADQSPIQPLSVTEKPRRRWAWILGGLVLLLFIIGIVGGNDENSIPPITTITPPTTPTPTPETQAPAGPAQVTVPGDLVGKNAQLADNELRMLGIVDISYASQDAERTFAPPLTNWTVARVFPAPGTAALTTNTVVITVTRKYSPKSVTPPAVTKPEPKPKPEPPGAALVPPADSSPDTSTGGSAYYRNCTAARAAGAAPLYRGAPGYRSALDRDGDGVACE